METISVLLSDALSLPAKAKGTLHDDLFSQKTGSLLSSEQTEGTNENGGLGQANYLHSVYCLQETRFVAPALVWLPDTGFHPTVGNLCGGLRCV